MGKKEKDPPPPPPEGSCHFFVQRKNRFCRFHPAKDANYCAEHASVHGVDLGRKRVDCPYDTKHTCYADKLNHHMKKCPSRPREMPPYHCAGINAGDDEGELVPDPKVTVLSVGLAEVEDIISRVTRLYDEHIGKIEEDILSHDCLKDELENPSFGTAALRHRRQQASLIGQMEKMSMLREGMCYLEMGAGKGQLSHWVHGAVTGLKDVGFVLIDRSHVRNKMDNLHKEEQVMERLKMDIEHLKLEEVPSIKAHQRQVLAFGKHLCGGATDLTLRCVIETLTDRCEAVTEDGSQRKRLKSDYKQLAGAVIALCCHHRCTWRPYVGKNFFRSCGLSARDFQLVSSMSSWATCTWKGWSNKRKAGNQDGSGDTSAVQGTIPGNHNNKQSEGGEGEIVESESDKVFTTSDEEKGVGTGTSKDVGGRTQDNVAGSNAADTSRSDAANAVDDDNDDTEMEHQVEEEVTNLGINSKLSPEEREVIGRKCKRLIDYGRVKYLQDHGFNSVLKVYIEDFYTPENVVLLAW